MAKLSTFKGFGASSAGASGESSSSLYDGTFALDKKSFDLSDDNRSLSITNLDAYGHPFRIRGLDTSTEAFFAMNCATRDASNNMSHTVTLFSVNQTTGVIAKKGIAYLYNTTNTSNEYSTFVGTSDEWSGRYTYSGNIPRSGSSAHAYGYNQGLVIWNGSSVSVDGTNTSDSTFYPASNVRETSAYVAPTERRFGGAVTHILPLYNTSSRAQPTQYIYGYSTSAINSTSAHQAPTGITASTITSTNYTVRHLWQWDVTNQPYYDYFHSMPEGIYARTRSSGTWSLFQSGGLDQQSSVFHLSNGNIIVYYNSVAYMVTSGGTKTTLTAPETDNVAASASRYSSYGNVTSVFNIGTDEWICITVGGWAWKFTINPTTGVVTESNKLQVSSILFGNITSAGYSRNGFPNITGSGNYSGNMFTFGNEHASGPGYGRTKLIHIAGISYSSLCAASYDMSGLIDALTYS